MAAVIGHISKCIDDVVLRITVRIFPIQKLWVNGEVHARLKAKTTRVPISETYGLDSIPSQNEKGKPAVLR